MTKIKIKNEQVKKMFFFIKKLLQNQKLLKTLKILIKDYFEFFFCFILYLKTENKIKAKLFFLIYLFF